ncbi:acyl-CoA thioesterase [Streptomyces sp. NPDC087300]|uniref:acyl-CoA thioesterase n=1 Tax=Streptomyces sp. NPDC087300 TaxID=3365780 RepID=UPI0037FCCA9B
MWEQQVSLSDLDWHGHVNNARMIAWIQDSWNDLLSPGEGVAPSFAAVSHEARYSVPLPYCASVGIHTVVTEIRRSRVTGTAKITDGGVVHAQITTSWVAFDVEARCARAVTEAERENLGRHYVPAEEAEAT